MALRHKFFRDPLFHFLLIAAGLFTLNAYTGREASESRLIEIDQARLDWLKNISRKEQGREPSAQELDFLIERYIREEVFFREALAMGMERDDVIVRRRLIEKLRFLMEDVAVSSSPDDERLQQFFELEKAHFSEPETYSFSHYYFSSESRADAREDSGEALAQLIQEGAPSNRLGDPFMMSYHYANKSAKKISDSFGEGFSDSLVSLTPGQWAGPVASEYGWHLVKVSHRSSAYIPVFDDVKPQVLLLWQKLQQEKFNEQTYMRLRQNYRINIHSLQGG